MSPDLCYESHYAALKFLVGMYVGRYVYVFQLQISSHAVANQLGEPMVAIVLHSKVEH